MDGVTLRLLGPVGISRNGAALPVPRGQTLTVLVTLALAANRVVSTDAIAAAVWGEDDPPANPRAGVHNAVARLRQLLGPTSIETVIDGYRLRADTENIDLLRFDALVDEAAGGSGEDALGRLETALGLWREPLLGGVPDPLRTESERWLRERRLDVQARRVELALEADRTDTGTITELTELVRAHPFDERLVGLLMRTCHRHGRQADALAEYERLRSALGEDLGIDPGAAIQQLYLKVLRGELPVPAAPARIPAKEPPRQLPAAPPRLYGRHRELADLDAWLAREPTGSGPRLVALVGPGGIGKTALALEWSGRLAERYPDGQLYVNLRGYGPGTPLVPARALESLLRALGIAAEELPADLEDRAARFRDALARRSMLIVLDNARDGEQVRPLLPGAGSLVVVTSRGQLRGLAARDGAYRVTLDRIGAAEARELLAEATRGPAGRFAEDEVWRLVELCAGLPLAIRIVAERMARAGGSLRETVAVLADANERLDALSSGDDDLADMRTVLSWSYRALDPEAARAFRLLGAQPGPEVSLPAASALFGVSRVRAENVLDRLIGTHLVEIAGPGRYRLHDIPRAYAAELAAEESVETAGCVRDLLDWYLLSAVNAMRGVYPGIAVERLELPTSAKPPLDFADSKAAYAWFELVYPSLVACVERAYALGLDGHAWKLAWSMWDFLDHRALYDDFIATHLVGLEAARRSGSLWGEGFMRHELSDIYLDLRLYDQSIEHAQATLAIARELGNPRSIAASYSGLGVIATETGDHDVALGHYTQALDIYIEVGDEVDESAMRVNIGSQLVKLGRFGEGLESLTRGREMIERTGHKRGLTQALTQLGCAHAGLGNHDQALAFFNLSVELNHEQGYRAMEANALTHAANSLSALGDRAGARDHLKQAYEIYRDVGLPRAAEIQRRIAELDG
ncbi:AfsR/SARP family transcriptional regulator [Actinospica sp.]|uniref:AfsR/SARP family transcriptional regulator n=1 Tax=Actinospica sp. TaxID=1872142 RepID=UPI002BA06618|nr:BTAD domain-containing putative transcriptional regulator [Actinospica sp.]HWG25246.1 BTAD domain-containing putative transcriptional regulator [Actinospica sp.]